MEYTQVNIEDVMKRFRQMIGNDYRFKKIQDSEFYDMFLEFVTECCDLENFYMQRLAEEASISESKIESNVIKHCQNLGYEPRRPIPAQAELIIRLKGPFPEEINKPGTEIFFTQEKTDLTFNGYKFILDSSYSYVLSGEDIAYCHESTWQKNLIAAVPHINSVYLPLQEVNYVNSENLVPIKCFQGERVTWVLPGSTTLGKLGKYGQAYKIDDPTFSNWYGKRDPYAYHGDRNYVQKNSWCKVGIGQTMEDAFDEDSLFDVETQSIKLNKKYRQIDAKFSNELQTMIYDVISHSKSHDKKYKENLEKEILTKQLKICAINNNSDKTVTISFGLDHNVISGLMKPTDNLYVQYISTTGKAANQTSVRDAIMTNENPVYASINGNIIDISNNIEFVLNSDIYGGDDFESMASMKVNGPAYYRRRGKLIMMEDFQNYFANLTSPMYVNTAYVSGQQEIERNQETSTLLPFTQNFILYTLLGRLYLKNDGEWTPRNVLTQTDTASEPFSLYGVDYANHICDYVKWLISPTAYYHSQYNSNSQEQWVKNAQLIRENCKDNLPMNTVILSTPPFIQYFDLVGTVNVKPTTDLLDYTTRMKNKIYSYLNDRSLTTPTVYKSDIEKIYISDSDTISVDVDIKVSSLIKAAENKYEWDLVARKLTNSTLYLDKTQSSYDSELDYLGVTQLPTSTYGLLPFNIIKVPIKDDIGKTLQEPLVNNQRVKFIATYANGETSEFNISTEAYRITDDDDKQDYILFVLPIVYKAPQTSRSTLSKLKLIINNENDFASTSKLNTVSFATYNIPPVTGTTITDTVTKIKNDLQNWISNLRITAGADRAIPLPYKVRLDTNTFAREETIMRKGNIISNEEYTLSEHSFWTYFAPYIINTYYKIEQDTLLDDDQWEGVSRLLYDLYTLVKPGICDSILDDNNNITNFSTNMEAAVLINKVNVIQQ